jgi:hypothetical protein
MLSPRALRNQRRLQYMLDENMKNKPVKIIECDENSQIFNWQRTYKKAAHKPLVTYDNKRKIKLKTKTKK